MFDKTELISLNALIGKKITDVHGWYSTEFGDPSFLIYSIVCEDGTTLTVGGEHDHPYIEDYKGLIDWNQFEKNDE